ncbi:GNAT family N-acetyltransferase [Phytohalomonas tamaricis]|uniref:GNAT family N-acetyltransferase n=1 Tax=Phytohalomonas tamaricis TaxID=2081032 RepID=UPI000D0B4577|nr:GNAT family N-acetyltransferase [Phytohalomonas tamaricis]
MIAIRPATPEDIPALWALRTRAVRVTCAAHYSHDEIACWTSLPAPEHSYRMMIEEGSALVAEEARCPLGYALLKLARGEVEGFFVDPDHGRRGVGTRLLKALEEIALAHGLRWLKLFAALNAVAFYRANGFTAIRAERFPHPSGVTLDCVYMEKPLQHG